MVGRGPALDACPFRHRTRYYDPETWLYYYGHRYYDPSVCKWISKDPLGESGGWNLTCFCANDPVNNYDPLGLASTTPLRVYFDQTTGRMEIAFESDIDSWHKNYNVPGCASYQAHYVPEEALRTRDAHMALALGTPFAIAAAPAAASVGSGALAYAGAWGTTLGASSVGAELAGVGSYVLAPAVTAATIYSAATDGDMVGSILSADVAMPPSCRMFEMVGASAVGFAERLGGSLARTRTMAYTEIVFNETIDQLAFRATQIPKSRVVIFGKYDVKKYGGRPYSEVGHENIWSYFQLADYDALRLRYGESYVRNANLRFVVNQWNENKEIMFSHNPWDASVLGGAGNAFEAEVLQLIDLGVRDFEEVAGTGLYRAVR